MKTIAIIGAGLPAQLLAYRLNRLAESEFPKEHVRIYVIGGSNAVGSFAPIFLYDTEPVRLLFEELFDNPEYHPYTGELNIRWMPRGSGWVCRAFDDFDLAGYYQTRYREQNLAPESMSPPSGGKGVIQFLRNGAKLLDDALERELKFSNSIVRLNGAVRRIYRRDDFDNKISIDISTDPNLFQNQSVMRLDRIDLLINTIPRMSFVRLLSDGFIDYDEWVSCKLTPRYSGFHVVSEYVIKKLHPGLITLRDERYDDESGLPQEYLVYNDDFLLPFYRVYFSSILNRWIIESNEDDSIQVRKRYLVENHQSSQMLSRIRYARLPKIEGTDIVHYGRWAELKPELVLSDLVSGLPQSAKNILDKLNLG